MQPPRVIERLFRTIARASKRMGHYHCTRVVDYWTQFAELDPKVRAALLSPTGLEMMHALAARLAHPEVCVRACTISWGRDHFACRRSPKPSLTAWSLGSRDTLVDGANPRDGEDAVWMAGAGQGRTGEGLPPLPCLPSCPAVPCRALTLALALMLSLPPLLPGVQCLPVPIGHVCVTHLLHKCST